MVEYERSTAKLEKMKKQAQGMPAGEEKNKLLAKINRLEVENNTLWQKICRRHKKEAKLRAIDKAKKKDAKTDVKDRKKAAKRAVKEEKRAQRKAKEEANKRAAEAKKVAIAQRKAAREAAKAEKQQRREDEANDPMSGDYE